MKKLSEMNTIEMASTLCALADPIGQIVTDPEFGEAVKNAHEQLGSKFSKIQMFGVASSTFIPLLLNKHCDATLSIVSAMTGKSMEEVRAQPGLTTMNEILEMLTKSVDLSRFRSAGSKAREE